MGEKKMVFDIKSSLKHIKMKENHVIKINLKFKFEIDFFLQQTLQTNTATASVAVTSHE